MLQFTICQCVKVDLDDHHRVMAPLSGAKDSCQNKNLIHSAIDRFYAAVGTPVKG